MYIIEVLDQKKNTLHSKNVGSWRDHAAELYGQIVRSTKPGNTVILIDSFNNEVLYKRKGESS